AGERDQRDVATAGGDRLGGVRDMDQVRGPAGLGGVDVPDLEVHVVDHVDAAHAGGVACAEVAVDIVEREARIGERAPGALVVQLGYRLVGGLAGRMLVGTDDVGLAFDRHLGPSPGSVRTPPLDVGGILCPAIYRETPGRPR